jgi:hypothetical protein
MQTTNLFGTLANNLIADFKIFFMNPKEEAVKINVLGRLFGNFTNNLRLAVHKWRNYT